jgi:hypothetical protein
MRVVLQEPPSLVLIYSFYALIAWGLVAIFAAFRVLAGEHLNRGIGFRVGLLVWLGIPAVLSFQGVFLDFGARPPQLMRVVIPMALVIVAFVFSPWGKSAAQKIPESLLVGTQVFRLPLEVILYALALRGLLPFEMTFSGYNFDIVTAVFALPLWWLVRRNAAPRWALLLWNIVGTLLLVAIVILAVLAFPEPFGWFLPENQIVAWFPWVWLPTFLVPLALVSHLLIFRKLAMPPPPELPNI